MNKRLICLALVLALMVPAVISAQALTDLNTYASGNFGRSFPVYSGPGEFYYRANSGKATYGGGNARIYGLDGDWIMIGYGMSDGGYRIGYITRDALSGLTNQKGTIRNLAFSNITMYAMEKCYLTDDPVINNKSIYTLARGQAVKALGEMGTGWTYVELMGSSSQMRGFVPSRCLSLDPTATPTPKPQPTATPYVPPIYYPTATPLPTYPSYPSYGGSTLLSSLSHNCPNTGIMAPATFSPYQNTYLLTVADWVTRVTFTPTAYDYNAVIIINGKTIRSGQTSQAFNMTDQPQAVTIQVQNGNASTTYTIYLQRRPSEKRTKVSAGYVNSIYPKGDEWRIDADLGTVKYLGEDYYSGNRSSFENVSVDRNRYDYAVAPNCIFYYGVKENCYRAYTVQEFMNNYARYGSSLYTFIYIEDEIVAVFPYGADY